MSFTGAINAMQMTGGFIICLHLKTCGFGEISKFAETFQKPVQTNNIRESSFFVSTKTPPLAQFKGDF